MGVDIDMETDTDMYTDIDMDMDTDMNKGKKDTRYAHWNGQGHSSLGEEQLWKILMLDIGYR